MNYFYVSQSVRVFVFVSNDNLFVHWVVSLCCQLLLQYVLCKLLNWNKGFFIHTHIQTQWERKIYWLANCDIKTPHDDIKQWHRNQYNIYIMELYHFCLDSVQSLHSCVLKWTNEYEITIAIGYRSRFNLTEKIVWQSQCDKYGIFDSLSNTQFNNLQLQIYSTRTHTHKAPESTRAHAYTLTKSIRKVQKTQPLITHFLFAYLIFLLRFFSS